MPPVSLSGPGAVVALPDAAYNAADPAPVQINTNGVAALLVGINVSVISGAAAAVVVTVEALDVATGVWRTLLASASLSAVAFTLLTIDARLTAAANSIAKSPVPSVIRIKPVKSGTTTTLNYSVSVDGTM